MVEQYAMNIPILAPAAAFAARNPLEFFGDRTSTNGPYCPGTDDAMLAPHAASPYHLSPNKRQHHADDIAFWIQFGEIYRWPCVTYYRDWDQLETLLRDTQIEELQKISRCMEQANKWRRLEAAQNWCWAAQKVETETPARALRNRGGTCAS